MKTFLILSLLLIFNLHLRSQVRDDSLGNNRYIKILPGSPQSPLNRIELSSDVDSTWNKWKERGYSFGFNPALTPMYTMVNGILSTPYMVQVRGNGNEKNKKRWGFHLFEGYASKHFRSMDTTRGI